MLPPASGFLAKQFTSKVSTLLRIERIKKVRYVFELDGRVTSRVPRWRVPPPRALLALALEGLDPEDRRWRKES